jgi:hypothetical protein
MPDSMLRYRIFAALLALAPAAPVPLAAQVKASERSTIAQVVNGTRIEVDYSRPQARGRETLFGGVVHWGEVWTPGANFATTLSADGPFALDGHELEEGSYSLWLIPREDGWTMVVSDEPLLFHTRHPQPDTWVAEYAVSPIEAQHTEVLTFDFPVVKPDHAVLRLRWGTTAIPFRIDVPGWEPEELDPEDIPRYAGVFAMEADDRPPFALGFWRDGAALRGVWVDRDAVRDPSVDPSELRGFHFSAVPLGLHRFLMGHYDEGELVNTEDGFLLFRVDASGDVVGLEWRVTDKGGEERSMARGERLR